MQEVLLAQKENAFLSQKLATIYTELELDVLPDSSFVPGLSNPDYISLLKKYEFKSLLPRETIARIPVQDIDIIDITVYDKLRDIHETIMVNTYTIVIAVDDYGKMVFSVL